MIVFGPVARTFLLPLQVSVRIADPGPQARPHLPRRVRARPLPGQPPLPPHLCCPLGACCAVETLSAPTLLSRAANDHLGTPGETKKTVL